MIWAQAEATEAGTIRPIRVNVPSRLGLLSDLRARLIRGDGFAVATLNLDHVVKLRADRDFLDAYARHSHVTADGNPVVWLSRLAGEAVELVPGSELIDPLAALAAELDVPVGLLGATQTSLDAAAEKLVHRHPRLRITARIAPPMGFDPEGPQAAACMSELEAAGVRLCFLALGAPRQERFAARAREELTQTGFVSIGAGLDFISGHQTRAPTLVRRLALEWLWRLLGNPGRLFVRYARCFGIMPGLVMAALGNRRRPASPGNTS